MENHLSKTLQIAKVSTNPSQGPRRRLTALYMPTAWRPVISVPHIGKLSWRMSVSHSKSFSIRANVLQIRDIQDVLKTEAEDTEEIPPPNLPKSPDILIDTTNSLTLTDICNSLPPRHIAGKLISMYFNSKHKQARTYVFLSSKHPADLYSNHSHGEVFKGGASITSKHLIKTADQA
jgi:hypothetical protein